MTVKDEEVRSFLSVVSENVKRIRKEKGTSYSLAHLYILAREWDIEISEFFNI